MMDDDENLLEEVITKLSKIMSLGNEGLDSNLGGGIPWGSLILISGENASGKSTLVQQFAMGALEQNKRVLYVNTEQTIDGMLKNMKSLSWEPYKYFLDDKFTIIPTITTKGKVKQNTDIIFPKLITLLNASKHELIIVDTVDFFTQGLSLTKFREFFVEMRQILRNDSNVVLVFPSFFMEENKLDQLTNLFDVYLDIKFVIDEGSGSLNRIVNVNKFRSTGELVSERIPILVDPAFGIRVSAVSTA
ncbi:MAG: AAA family ATPase [Candidatus Heimdallarchaeota archaeon]|nr:AAA family ATPase [Candidatus Heimdallarchaeota archaeon]MDH5645765.1 AAA family ATPase [Candidatus Heimdallarchaeota archaeon]